MSALVKEKIYTPEQYLELERAAEERHEYLDGQIYLMSGGSPKHRCYALACCFLSFFGFERVALFLTTCASSNLILS